MAKQTLKFSNGVKVTSYMATACAEGFCEGEGASTEDQLIAWAYLIKTGMCWNLQGFFGRTANKLIQNNIITTAGVINWNAIDELNN